MERLGRLAAFVSLFLPNRQGVIVSIRLRILYKNFTIPLTVLEHNLTRTR